MDLLGGTDIVVHPPSTNEDGLDELAAFYPKRRGD